MSSAVQKLRPYAAYALVAGLIAAVILLVYPAGANGLTISGQKFHDLDGDGVKDGGEPGIEGWVIHLFGAADEATATNQAGIYQFDGLAPGTYTVCEELPPPWIQSFPGPATTPPASDGAACEGDGYLNDPGPHGYTVELTQNALLEFGNYQKVSKEGVKFEDKNNDGIRTGGEPRLGGWEIRAYRDTNVPIGVLDQAEFNAGPAATTTTANGTGFYHFSLDPGHYIFCEVRQAGYNQTFPTGLPEECAAGTDETPPLGPQGHAEDLPSGEEEHGNDFGNHKPPCEKGPVQEVLHRDSGRFPGNDGPDIIVRLDQGGIVQNAVDNVTDVNNDNYLIIMVVKDGTGQLGGHTTQDVEISQNYAKGFALIGCSVTLHDPTPSDGSPTIHIQAGANSPSNIFLMDLHAADSGTAGILVEGNGRYLRNEAAEKNAVGIKIFNSNGNTVHNGEAVGNGVGVLVQGNSNVLTDVDAFSNTSHGFQVIGNSNQLLKLDAGDRGKGNGGDGVNVNGNSNLLKEISSFANKSDGIEVAGSLNTLLKNVAGDSNKGNEGNGFLINGSGNGTPNPVELEQNTARKNTLNGFKITGTGYELKSNVSGGTSGQDNGKCEFAVVGGNFNSKDNKANNVTVTPNTDGAAFPTACLGTGPP